jgi:hypothetical protein
MAIESEPDHTHDNVADFAWVGIAILVTLIVIISIYEYLL